MTAGQYKIKFLHYTLHAGSSVVAVYNRFQHAEVISVSNTTYRQLTFCDPLYAFKIVSAQDVTQPVGSAVLYRPEIYTLKQYIPAAYGVTAVLVHNGTNMPVAVTALTLPSDPFATVVIVAKIMHEIAQNVHQNIPHIVSGDFQVPVFLNWSRECFIEHGYHDLLQAVQSGPTRFRLHHPPDVSDYIFYRGDVAVMECTLYRPDVGSDHCPIYVFFFGGKFQTHDL